MTEQQEKRIKDKIKFVQDTLYVISGKWKLPIIISLYYGNARFKDLQATIPKITNRVLSKELKELEANQLITRTVYDTSPVSIEYALAEYSHTLLPVIQTMAKWGEQHRVKVTGK
jgi:DNA-binding HxlR family transcriptional regulator